MADGDLLLSADGSLMLADDGSLVLSNGGTDACCCTPPCLPLDQMVVDLAGLTRKTGCINSIGFEPYLFRSSTYLHYLPISGAVPAGRFILPMIDSNPTFITYQRLVQCSPLRTTAAFACSDAEATCHSLAITVLLNQTARTARVTVYNAATASPTRIPPFTSSDSNGSFSSIAVFSGTATYPACWTSPITAGNTLSFSGNEQGQPYIVATGGTAVIRPYQAGLVESFNTDPACGCPSGDEGNPFP